MIDTARPVHIVGPTFEEMLQPERIPDEIRQAALTAKTNDPLHPINLFNITWKNQHNRVNYQVLPKQLTRVETPIVVLYGNQFPTGAHKVGAAYSVLIEEQLLSGVDPSVHTLVWPSTGNYGIGGAFVGCRMNFDSVVILPEDMSRERFEYIEKLGARIIRTPGSESNVKEIYDKTWELAEADSDIRILNQFKSMGNYRFHYYVTGNTMVELAQTLAEDGVGAGKISAFTSAMGSAGTIAAGDRIKQVFPDAKTIGLEPIQCSTLYSNGYGSHRIEGIGDKHVTWIHNVLNMDALICIDDMASVRGMRLLGSDVGYKVLANEYRLAPEALDQMKESFGMSGVCNVLGAIKAVKHYGFGPDDLVITVVTDGLDRYYSTMDWLCQHDGDMDETMALAYMESTFRGQDTRCILEGTPDVRERWHNLKYYTWVEQQRMTVEELDAQRDPAWWQTHQQIVGEIDKQIRAARATKSFEALIEDGHGVS